MLIGLLNSTAIRCAADFQKWYLVCCALQSVMHHKSLSWHSTQWYKDMSLEMQISFMQSVAATDPHIPEKHANSIAILQATLNAVADGIIVVDFQGEIVLMNPQFLNMWSIPSRCQGKSAVLKYAVAQIKEPRQAITRFNEIYGDSQINTHDVIELKDGRTFECISMPQYIDGEIVGRVWTFRDITAQQEIEKALREREEQYRELLITERRHLQELQLLDRVRTSLSRELNLSVIFRKVVEAIVETFGYNQVSIYLLDGEVLKLQYQLGYNQVISEIHISQGVSGEVVRTGRPVLIEDVSKMPSFLGAIEGIVSEVCVPLFDEGRVVGFINVESINNLQLTEADLSLMIALSEHISIAINRARLYTAVRQQEEQYRQLFEVAPIGMGITNHEGTLIFANQSFANTLGYELAELQQKNLHDIAYADDKNIDLALIEQLFAQEIPNYRVEKRFVRKDGSLAYVSLQVSLLPDIDNRPRYMIAQIVDLSEVKQTEEALRQAQKTESLGLMAGGIAHDFNNLLVAIIGQSSLALTKLDKEHEAAVHVRKTLGAAERAAALTQQLLAYSGQGKFQISALNLNESVLENLSLIELALPQHVQIKMILADDLPAIEADPNQIQQIIMNLIINGAEATDSHIGQITLVTRVAIIPKGQVLQIPILRKQLPEGRYVVLEVQDNGSGMDSKTLEKIFDPFFTTKFTGRGLGLAAVLGIVRGHRGGIIVNSVPHQGTKFALYFPALEI